MDKSPVVSLLLPIPPREDDILLEKEKGRKPQA
jgi:hypothetical protein